jgi:O-antigen/teichoic acid export membrane protein
MASTDAALWQQRFVRFAIGGSAPLIAGTLGALRNKWLATHLETAGFGVLAQVISSQIWLGTMTGLGLGIPLAQAIARAGADGDPATARRASWTAVGLIAPCALVVVAAGLTLAPAISRALLGSPSHASLIRISMLGVAGLAFQNLMIGVFAGRSDVRGPVTISIAGGLGSLLVTLALVPGHGLTGGSLGAAVAYPCGAAAAFLFHRRAYRSLWIPRAGFDPRIARTFLEVAAAALTLALVDQGVMIALRAHYLRVNGIAANGLLQSGLSLAQQLGGLFYAYLASYAFGRISAARDREGVREYTRRLWIPVMLVAAAAFAGAMLMASPLLHLFFSSRFDGARPMMAWTMAGEFARVVVQVWALGALPLGGVRLWMPVGVASTASLAIAYLIFHAAGAGMLSLPLAYASGSVVSLAFTAWWMGRRGVAPTVTGGAVLAATLLGLLLLARARSG